MAQFDGGKIVLAVCSTPYKCPGAPHEGAMLLQDYFRRQRLKVDIHIYTPESQPMPVAGPQMGEALKQMLASKGISFHPLHKLVSVDPQKRLLFFEGQEPVSYDLLIAIPPHCAPRVVHEAGLVDKTGWVPVDRWTLKTGLENVYALGDVTAVDIPGRWKAEVPLKLPKAGVFAHLEAEVIADRIAHEINGLIPKAVFSGLGYCILETGNGRAALAFGNFFAEPTPRVEMRNIRRRWHLGKVLFEKWWLAPFGVRKSVLRFLLNFGANLSRLPIRV